MKALNSKNIMALNELEKQFSIDQNIVDKIL